MTTVSVNETINQVTVTETTVGLVLSTAGPTGPAGDGLPIGGDMGDIIIKNTSANYDASWVPTLDGGTFN